MKLLDQDGHVLVRNDCVTAPLGETYRLLDFTPASWDSLMATWHRVGAKETSCSYIPHSGDPRNPVQLQQARYQPCETCSQLLACTLNGVTKALELAHVV